MKTRIVTSIFLAGLTMAFGPSPLQAEVIDKVVATVNQEPITQYELDRVITTYQQQETLKASGGKDAKKSSAPAGAELRKEALDHLIDETLLNQEIDRQGIKVTDDDINQAIESILKRNSITLDQLKKELNSKGTSYEDYRADLKGQVRRLRYIGQIVGNKIHVTDDDVQSFMDQNSDKLKNVQEVHIAQIVFPFESGSEAGVKKAGTQAQEVYKKIKAGGDFDALMKEGGTGSGDLGTVSFTGLAPQVSNALQALEAGQVSDPSRTQAGFIIVKVLDRPGGVQANEQVKAQLKDRIYEMKMQEEIQRYVNQLKSKAFIDIKS
jgi:peptidyl-prolyl cis-trans isomerase SurA